MIDFQVIKTRVMNPPKDDIYSLFEEKSFPEIKEKSVLFITSKILAIHQGNCRDITKEDKEDLIHAQADKYIAKTYFKKIHPVDLTLKRNVLIPFAGIDESNGGGYYILWPEDVDSLLADIHHYLCKKYSIESLGVVAIDSQPIILKIGVMSTTMGLYGVNPIRNYQNQKDLFQRELEITRVNVIDSISGTCGLLMGEGSQSTPMVLVNGMDFEYGRRFSFDSMKIDLEDDMYYPILKDFI